MGLFHGIILSRLCPPINHLLFADDVMIFSRANNQEAETILRCLSSYSAWSGQHINLAKSAIFFSSNTRPGIKSYIDAILHLPPSAS
ncbi:hypothetical protein SLA2020_318790 [Shorea laevis]